MWSQVHDFTPVPGENNFTLLHEDAKMEDYITMPTTEQFSGMQLSYSADESVVPLTLGSQRKPSDQVGRVWYTVLFFASSVVPDA